MAETRITNGNRDAGRSEKRSTLSARNSHGVQSEAANDVHMLRLNEEAAHQHVS